jgi:hypothetical protein
MPKKHFIPYTIHRTNPIVTSYRLQHVTPYLLTFKPSHDPARKVTNSLKFIPSQIFTSHQSRPVPHRSKRIVDWSDPSPKRSLNQIGLDTDVLVWVRPCPDRWDQWIWNHLPSIACILNPSASTSVRLKLANTVRAAIVWTLAVSMGCPSGRFFASAPGWGARKLKSCQYQ